MIALAAVAIVLSGCDLLGPDDVGDDINQTADEPIDSIVGEWVKDGSPHIKVQFSESSVYFWQHAIPLVDETWALYGVFDLSSYDGETVEILDYDGLIVQFSSVLAEEQLVVSDLNAIRLHPPPYDRRDYQFWNGTYDRLE